MIGETIFKSLSVLKWLHFRSFSLILLAGASNSTVVNLKKKKKANGFLSLPGADPEGEPMRYSAQTLVLMVLVPFAVLALLAMLAVPVWRRLHPRRLERLHEFDTEQGAIDGLIASNVGDSTLAVRPLTALF